MALNAGSVSVDGTTGAVSGSGYARDLYDVEAGVSSRATVWFTGPIGDAAWHALFGTTFDATAIEARQGLASKCNALAAAHVALIQTGTVVVPPGNAGGTFPVV